jgi:hypothetical protein
MRIHVHVCRCACMCTFACMHARMQVCVRPYVRTHARMWTCLYLAQAFARNATVIDGSGVVTAIHQEHRISPRKDCMPVRRAPSRPA